MSPILLALLGKAFEAIQGYFPTPESKAAAQLALMQLSQASEFKQIDAVLAAAAQQTDINKVEAASSDKYTSRARPTIMWICGIGLGVQFLISPFATWFAALAGHPITFPALDMGTLLTLLLGMLGLGGMRTMEKLQGKA